MCCALRKPSLTVGGGVPQLDWGSRWQDLCSEHRRSGGGDGWAARLGDLLGPAPTPAAQLPAVFAMTVLFGVQNRSSLLRACSACGTTPLSPPPPVPSAFSLSWALW